MVERSSHFCHHIVHSHHVPMQMERSTVDPDFRERLSDRLFDLVTVGVDDDLVDE